MVQARRGERARLKRDVGGVCRGTDPDGAAAMLYLAKAGGKHLDLTRGALRLRQAFEGENDANFRRRILAELLNPRSTAEAIKSTIEAALPGVRARVTTPVETALNEGLRFIDWTWYLGRVLQLHPRGGERGRGALHLLCRHRLERTPTW